MGAASISSEFCVVADVKIEQVTFAPSATADLDRACVVKVDETKEMCIRDRHNRDDKLFISLLSILSRGFLLIVTKSNKEYCKILIFYSLFFTISIVK